MTEGVELIVNFEAPPVVEVVAGVALEDVGAETGALMAAFWKERLRKKFPLLEQQPPYVPSLEQFGNAVQSPNLIFQLGAGFPGARLLASTTDRQELIQLQPGWFACNWRKVQASHEYDHWPKRRADFDKWFNELVNYLASVGARAPKVTQCEVTYINHIYPGAVWRQHSHFERIFASSLGQPGKSRLEQITAQAQFTIGDVHQPAGRLHVKILPAYAKDGRTPLYVLELTARGTAPSGGPPTDFLNLGREAIVGMFLEITTPEMQAEWKRVKDNDGN